MTSSGIKSLLGLMALAALSFTRPIQGEGIDPEYRELLRQGNSRARTGSALMWTGTALLPLGALALVPVLYDGAFGITAADPGFAIFFALAGGGLIHAGIPIYGSGAGKLEKAAGGSAPDGSESAASGWSHYRRGWLFLAGGSAVAAAAFPFAIAGGLEWQKEDWTDYTAATLLYTGVGLMAIGALEQHYSLYRFVKSAGHSRERLKAGPQVSLQPLLLLDKQGPGAGMRLTCSF